MMLAQGRFWRVDYVRASARVQLGFIRDGLPDDLRDLKELRLEVPLEWWGKVVKHVRTDRKLFGGVVLDFVKQKDQLSAMLGNDRLYSELQRVVVDATVVLVESGLIVLSPAEVGGER